MNEAILPTYLPAVAVTFTKKGGSEPVHVFRPYEAIPIAELKQHAEKEEIGALLQLGERCFYGNLGAEQDFEAAYDYLKRAAACARALAKARHWRIVNCLDADGQLRTIDDIGDEITAAVLDALKSKSEADA